MIRIAATTLTSDSTITIARFRPSKMTRASVCLSSESMHNVAADSPYIQTEAVVTPRLFKDRYFLEGSLRGSLRGSFCDRFSNTRGPLRGPRVASDTPSESPKPLRTSQARCPLPLNLSPKRSHLKSNIDLRWLYFQHRQNLPQ